MSCWVPSHHLSFRSGLECINYLGSSLGADQRRCAATALQSRLSPWKSGKSWAARCSPSDGGTGGPESASTGGHTVDYFKMLLFDHLDGHQTILPADVWCLQWLCANLHCQKVSLVKPGKNPPCPEVTFGLQVLSFKVSAHSCFSESPAQK